MAESVFPSRSQAIEVAVQEKLARLEQGRLARECAKLDPNFEKALVEEGFARTRLNPVRGREHARQRPV